MTATILTHSPSISTTPGCRERGAEYCACGTRLRHPLRRSRCEPADPVRWEPVPAGTGDVCAWCLDARAAG